MYKQCVTKNARARQREIENGLMHMMTVKSFEQITVSDLCDSLNIPRKAFYRYFSSKEGALYALIDHTLGDFLEEFAQIRTNSSSVRRIMISFFQFWLKHGELLDALAHNNLSGMLLQRSLDIALSNEDLINLIFTDSKQVSNNYIAIYIISGIISLVIQWHRDKFAKSPEQMTAIALSVVPYSMANMKQFAI